MTLDKGTGFDNVKICRTIDPEKEVEALNARRKMANPFKVSWGTDKFLFQMEIDDPTDEVIQKVEGLLDDMKKMVAKAEEG